MYEMLKTYENKNILMYDKKHQILTSGLVGPCSHRQNVNARTAKDNVVIQATWGHFSESSSIPTFKEEKSWPLPHIKDKLILSLTPTAITCPSHQHLTPPQPQKMTLLTSFFLLYFPFTRRKPTVTIRYSCAQ